MNTITLSLIFTLSLGITVCGFSSGRESIKHREGSVTIDGSELKYVARGKGPECLVIGSSVYYPKTFSERLSSEMTMYFIDLKWFSEKYKPENLDSVSIKSIADDIREIITRLGLKKPILIGHSIHGTIALEYAKRYPGTISAVIAVGSPAEFGNNSYQQKYEAHWAEASEERKALQERNWGRTTELDRLTGKDSTVNDYNNASPQYWYDPEYDAGWLWNGMTVHTEVTHNLFTRVFSGYNMFAQPFSLKLPVLVAMGKYDYVIPWTLWCDRYNSIPDFTLLLFEKSGHTPQLEEQELFDEKILGWLRSHKLLKGGK